MLELGNETQVRSALEGNSGFEKGVEDELIRRVAVAETEQDSYEPLSKINIGGFIVMGIIGFVLTIVSFI